MIRKYDIEIGQVFGELEVISKRMNMEQSAPYCMCRCKKCGSTERYKIRELHKLHPPNGNRICKACFWNSKGGQNAAYRLAMQQAKQRGIEFRLELEEFIEIINKDCYWCGKGPVEKHLRSYQKLKSTIIRNGIDRLDSLKGYESSNCVPCCEQCNIAKMDYTKEEFLAMVKRIYKKHFDLLENQL